MSVCVCTCSCAFIELLIYCIPLQELLAEFDAEMKKRELEFQQQEDEMSNLVLSHKLKVILIKLLFFNLKRAHFITLIPNVIYSVNTYKSYILPCFTSRLRVLFQDSRR